MMNQIQKEAIKAAQEGKRIWAATPLHERCRILSRYADLIEEHRQELAGLLMKDNGKSKKDAEAEMLRIDVMIRGFAEHATHLYTDCLTDAQPGMERSMFVTRREPLGVIACIVPFNHPASLYTQKVAPALAMGNAVIIKPASPVERVFFGVGFLFGMMDKTAFNSKFLCDNVVFMTNVVFFHDN